MTSTLALSKSNLWTKRTEWLSFEEHVTLSYARAKSVIDHFQITYDDIVKITDRFIEFHSDPILTKDFSVASILMIHLNLCAGTLAKLTDGRPEHLDIIQKLLTFEWSGQFCLSEVGHGLDAISMETTCTLLPSGQFDLHTPLGRAAKYMPATSPSGIPCISIVHARLSVKGQDLGPKVFLVKLNDGKVMNPGITSRVLAPRGGSSPFKHCITSFNHVTLPPDALLGSLDGPPDIKVVFFSNIARVITGTFILGFLGIACLRTASYIGGRYSQRRTVFDVSTGKHQPIISYSTQHVVVMSAISQTMVLGAMGRFCHKLFASEGNSTKRHFIAAIFKTTVMSSVLRVTSDLATRCGAQGLQAVNQFSTMHADFKGASIAEGDLLAISIKFALDLLKGRISAPMSTGHSVLHEREKLMTKSLRSVLISGTPTTRDAIQRILPHCQALIEAIGHRMAFEAAVNEGIDSEVIDMFVASVLQLDVNWNPNTHREIHGVDAQVLAAGKLLPKLDALLEKLNVAEYVTAAIVSDREWDTYVDTLPVHKSAM